MTEDLERRLRRALTDEASRVRPSDGLPRIRAAIESERVRRERHVVRLPTVPRLRHWTPLVAAATILALAVLTPVLFRLVGPEPNHAAAASPSVVSADPLPVYFVAQENGRQALVREFHPTTLTGLAERLNAAVRLSVTGAAVDPDYTTAWPAGVSVEATLSADLISVRVSTDGTDSSLLGGSRTLEQARLAVDQVVWTATATVQQLLPVTVSVGDAAPGSDQRLFGVLDLNRPFQRELGPVDPRAPVWVSSLLDGERLAAGAVSVTGDAAGAGTLTSPPGRWTLELLGDRGTATRTVASGELTAVLDPSADTSTASRRAWQIVLPLTEPGRYLLIVEQDGWTDTKQLTVG